MRYLLLSVLVIFAIGFFVVEDAFGIEYTRVNIQHSTDTTDCGDDNSCHSPHTITIKQFEWVKWKNLDITTHTITAGYPHDPLGGKADGYDSGPIASGSTFEYQFHQKGKYPYFCQIHPWAQGFVIVTEGTSSAPPPAPPPAPPAQTQTTTSQKIPTTLYLFSIPSQISDGDSLTVSGMLTSKEDGFVMPVRDATIYVNMEITFRGETNKMGKPLTLKTDRDGKFSTQSPNLDLPPEVRENITLKFYAIYKGGSKLESSTSDTYTVIVVPSVNSGLPPGVSINAPNFESSVGYTIAQLYENAQNPQKDYYFFNLGGYGLGNTEIVRGDRHDLLVFNLLFENTENTPVDLERQYIIMIDGKDREFSPVSSFIQTFGGAERNYDFDWNEECPLLWRSITIQPGLTGEAKLCFEIPKDADHFKVIDGDNALGDRGWSYGWTPQVLAFFDREFLGVGGSSSASTATSEQQTQQSKGGGCLIATAAFGSEMAPQVQFLRELRDNTVLQTESGTNFMTGFNQFYYSFSPTIADYERENPAFKEAVKITLTPLLTSLTLLQYVDIDSESEMLGYGIGVILLNIGMYFVAPAILIMTVRKRI